MNDTAASKPVRWPRVAVVVLAVAFIHGAPFYRQVLHGHAQPLRGWNMFSTMATELCRVRFVRRDAAGDTPIDRYALSGFPYRQKAPLRFRVLRKPDEVKHAGERICTKLGAGADVRATYQCARGGAWRGQPQTTGNLCAEAP